jgi:hypothetical protein
MFNKVTKINFIHKINHKLLINKTFKISEILSQLLIKKQAQTRKMIGEHLRLLSQKKNQIKTTLEDFL